MWREMNGKSLMTFVEQSEHEVSVYFYIPICGNCKAARRLMEHALALCPNQTVISTNLNLIPQAAVRYQIERLPALYVLKAGEVVRKRYDFPSPAILAAWMEFQSGDESPIEPD